MATINGTKMWLKSLLTANEWVINYPKTRIDQLVDTTTSSGYSLENRGAQLTVALSDSPSSSIEIKAYRESDGVEWIQTANSSNNYTVTFWVGYGNFTISADGYKTVYQIVDSLKQYQQLELTKGSDSDE